MKTTEFCRLAHTTRDTLRYYDSLGILKPHRLENTYREYTSADLNTYNIIQNLKSAGLSLTEISQVLLLQAQPITPECRQSVLTMIQDKNDYFTNQYRFFTQLMTIASQMKIAVQNNHQEQLESLIEKLGKLTN
ncbi:MAG TPA: MerR family transcriptional regulator [Candidatus Levilactobacillus faecigallinarum]|uniref:MerR family transcriptional regulator n=1 Tax=Candidatus Levilactobacillus faecigallinarum TaxID=2838638 RepID=A0A9D1QPP0_9LACO|nr:MerR family transcriptional regulator [Candidatus Levilactobacillus faecigallinarum]